MNHVPKYILPTDTRMSRLINYDHIRVMRIKPYSKIVEGVNHVLVSYRIYRSICCIQLKINRGKQKTERGKRPQSTLKPGLPGVRDLTGGIITCSVRDIAHRLPGIYEPLHSEPLIAPSQPKSIRHSCPHVLNKLISMTHFQVRTTTYRDLSFNLTHGTIQIRSNHHFRVIRQ